MRLDQSQQTLPSWDSVQYLRLISVDEVMETLESGALEEAWGCGTAAVISPIGRFAYKEKAFAINNQEIGPCSKELYDT